MRRTAALLRGAKGLGWYGKYMEEGANGFRKYNPPTPFNWSNPPAPRPVAFFEITVDSSVLGEIKFELANDILPKTVDNFCKLCRGEGVVRAGYYTSRIHYIKKGESLIGGDIETNEGHSSHSAYSERFFEDENYIIPHSQRGLISMASVGRNTNGSQFYIDFAPAPHLDGRCMVFGRIISGNEILDQIEKMFCVKNRPVKDIIISKCGVISN